MGSIEEGGGGGAELADLFGTDDDGAFLQAPDDTTQEQAAANKEFVPTQEYPDSGIDLDAMLSDKDQRAAVEAIVSIAQSAGDSPEEAIAAISQTLAPEMV